MENTSFMGLNGFVWWMGVVENRHDPLMLGRCQIRIFGWHTDNKSLIPTDDLPWAQPVLPSNSSTSIGAPKEGDMAFGFFSDGSLGQFPIFLGVFPGIPSENAVRDKGFSDSRNKDELDNSPVKPIKSTILQTTGVSLKTENKSLYPRNLNVPNTSKLSRNETTANTVIDFRKSNWIKADSTGGSTWKEPYPGYNTVYPYNTTTESESGHIMQFDDTPGNERVMISHRTGSTFEMYNSGTKLEKIVKDNYTIVHGSDFCHVEGKLELSVENVAKIRIKGKTTIEIDGDVDWKVAGDMNLSVGKSLNIKAGKNMSTEVVGLRSDKNGTKNETTTGTTNIRYNSDLHTWVGGNLYTRKQAGQVDYSCPADIRTSGTDCSDVTSASITILVSPNSYTNPTETQIIPERIKPVKYPQQAVPKSELPVTKKSEVPIVPEVPPVKVVPEEHFANTTNESCFTLPMLKAAAPASKESVLTKFLPGFNKICNKYNINTQLRKAHFLAQTAHESGGFNLVQEGLNYSASGLLATFPKYFNSSNVDSYARQPEKIANHVYANRMGNGDETSGDGYTYRGRGLIQLTGKDNYTRFGNSVGLSLSETVAYLETTDGAVESAAWYWNSRTINSPADANNIKKVTKLVNGGQIGLDDRTSRFNNAYPLCA